jgi:GxxExxY protein
MIEEELTRKIIKLFYRVYNELGHGFIESIYHNAFLIELAKEGIPAETKKKIVVYYLQNAVGTFEADLVIDGKVILELKAKERLHSTHETQLINYLRATDIEVGLLLNFGKNPEFKRKVFSNGNKRHEPCPSTELGSDPFLNDPR